MVLFKFLFNITHRMADNGKTAEKDTEASQATQEQQVSHVFHDSHIQLHNRNSVHFQTQLFI